MLFKRHWISKPLDKGKPGLGAEEIQETATSLLSSLSNPPGKDFSTGSHGSVTPPLLGLVSSLSFHFSAALDAIDHFIPETLLHLTPKTLLS